MQKTNILDLWPWITFYRHGSMGTFHNFIIMVSLTSMQIFSSMGIIVTVPLLFGLIWSGYKGMSETTPNTSNFLLNGDASRKKYNFKILRNKNLLLIIEIIYSVRQINPYKQTTRVTLKVSSIKNWSHL